MKWAKSSSQSLFGPGALAGRVPVAERRSKVMEAGDAIRRFVPQDATGAGGGMHQHNPPMALVREAIRQGVRIGTLVTSPSASIQADLPIAAGPGGGGGGGFNGVGQPGR